MAEQGSATWQPLQCTPSQQKPHEQPGQGDLAYATDAPRDRHGCALYVRLPSAGLPPLHGVWVLGRPEWPFDAHHA